MRHRLLTYAAAVACSTAWLLSVTAAAQTSLPGAEAVKALVAARMAKNFTPPKTSWGDPDIAGIFTTKDEANTPLERPAQWVGRRMEDITPKEFAEAVQGRQQEAVETAPFLGGTAELVARGVAIAVPIHWFDNLAAKNTRPWWVIDPPEGVLPALAPGADAYKYAGTGAWLADSRDHYRDVPLRCIGGGGPWRTPHVYGNSQQIIQTPTRVIFRHEAAAARTIRLDSREHRPADRRTSMGDSVGWWEGNTLVVETTNFSDAAAHRGGSIGANTGREYWDAYYADTYSMRDLRLIERFTRIGPNTVEWSVTFDAPKVWTRPWTYSLPMTEDDTQIIHEYACHEGNLSMANTLNAGRAMDKKTSKE